MGLGVEGVGPEPIADARDPVDSIATSRTDTARPNLFCMSLASHENRVPNEV